MFHGSSSTIRLLSGQDFQRPYQGRNSCTGAVLFFRNLMEETGRPVPSHLPGKTRFREKTQSIIRSVLKPIITAGFLHWIFLHPGRKMKSFWQIIPSGQGIKFERQLNIRSLPIWSIIQGRSIRGRRSPFPSLVTVIQKLAHLLKNGEMKSKIRKRSFAGLLIILQPSHSPTH